MSTIMGTTTIVAMKPQIKLPYGFGTEGHIYSVSRGDPNTSVTGEVSGGQRLGVYFILCTHEGPPLYPMPMAHNDSQKKANFLPSILVAIDRLQIERRRSHDMYILHDAIYGTCMLTNITFR